MSDLLPEKRMTRGEAFDDFARRVAILLIVGQVGMGGVCALAFLAMGSLGPGLGAIFPAMLFVGLMMLTFLCGAVPGALLGVAMIVRRRDLWVALALLLVSTVPWGLVANS